MFQSWHLSYWSRSISLSQIPGQSSLLWCDHLRCSHHLIFSRWNMLTLCWLLLVLDRHKLAAVTAGILRYPVNHWTSHDDGSPSPLLYVSASLLSFHGMISCIVYVLTVSYCIVSYRIELYHDDSAKNSDQGASKIAVEYCRYVVIRDLF